MFLVRFNRSVTSVQQDLSCCALSIGCPNVGANRTWKESYTLLLLLSFVYGHMNLLSDAELSFQKCHLGVLRWKSKLESVFNRNSIEDLLPSCISTLTLKIRDKITRLGVFDVGESFSEVFFLSFISNQVCCVFFCVSSFFPQFWWKQIVPSVWHRTSNFLFASLLVQNQM